MDDWMQLSRAAWDNNKCFYFSAKETHVMRIIYSKWSGRSFTRAGRSLRSGQMNRQLNVKCSVSTWAIGFHTEMRRLILFLVLLKIMSKIGGQQRRSKTWEAQLCSRKAWIMKRLQHWYWQFLFSQSGGKKKVNTSSCFMKALKQPVFLATHIYIYILTATQETILPNLSATPMLL